MPDHVFDRWTRRRFGQVAGALITAPVLVGAASPAGAKRGHGKKNKNKKKKPKCLDFHDGECQDLGEHCNPFGTPCCDCAECAQLGGPDVPFVCVQ